MVGFHEKSITVNFFLDMFLLISIAIQYAIILDWSQWHCNHWLCICSYNSATLQESTSQKKLPNTTYHASRLILRNWKTQGGTLSCLRRWDLIDNDGRSIGERVTWCLFWGILSFPRPTHDHKFIPHTSCIVFSMKSWKVESDKRGVLMPWLTWALKTESSIKPSSSKQTTIEF